MGVKLRVYYLSMCIYPTNYGWVGCVTHAGFKTKKKVNPRQYQKLSPYDLMIQKQIACDPTRRTLGYNSDMISSRSSAIT